MVTSQWQHAIADAAGAWNTTDGRGVRVAIIDHGFHLNHPDLKDGIDRNAIGSFRMTSGGAVFVGGEAGFPPGDHGTFCAGIVGARRSKEGGCGVAPGCELIPIACLYDEMGTQVTLARALAYAVDPARERGPGAPMGADIVVCSLGPDGTPWRMEPVLDEALNFAYSAGRNGLGTPVFWAAGNNRIPIGHDEVCCHHATIAVGQSNRLDEHGAGAFGSQLEFLAPGVAVYSTVGHNGYGTSTGTSFAAAYSAGVAALVLAANPELSAMQVREILQGSCAKIGTIDVHGRSDVAGHGRISASKAVATASSFIEGHRS